MIQYICRKFFEVPDDAYLSTNVVLDERIELNISKDRTIHLLGRYQWTTTKYYSDFKNVDESFKNEPIKYMSKLTHNIMGAIGYNRGRQIRDENYLFLESKLNGSNKLKLKAPDGAFAYPYYVENLMEIKRRLAQKSIFIQTLWPNVLNDIDKDSIEYSYATNILPLI